MLAHTKEDKFRLILVGFGRRIFFTGWDFSRLDFCQFLLSVLLRNDDRIENCPRVLVDFIVYLKMAPRKTAINLVVLITPDDE